MAKRKPNAASKSPNWKAMHTKVDKQGAQLKQARESGYRGLTKGLDRMYNELASTTKGARSRLTRGNERDLSKIKQALRRQEAANKRVVTRTQTANKGMGDVGGMMAQSYRRSEAPAQLNAKVAKKAGQATVEKETKTGTRSQLILDIIEQSQGEMRAASDYQASRALSDRTQQDASQIAAQHHDIAMAKLQHQLQLKQMEAQLENQQKQMMWELKQSEKALGRETFQTIRPQIQTMATLTADVLRWRREDPSLTQEQMIEKLVNERVISADDATSAPVISMVKALYTNNQPGVADSKNLVQEMLWALEQTPQWKALTPKQRKKLEKDVATAASTISLQKVVDAVKSGSFQGNPLEDLIEFGEKGKKATQGLWKWLQG
jgi:hypothetical protein